MTTPTIADLLKYADLPMATEAFLVNGTTPKSGIDLKAALIRGNYHASNFTGTQATGFVKHWGVVDQKAKTATGFSGALVFTCIDSIGLTMASGREEQTNHFGVIE